MKFKLLPVVFTAAITSMATFYIAAKYHDELPFTSLSSHQLPVNYTHFTGNTTVASGQPIDFQLAAEASVKAVVHVKTQTKARAVTAQDIFGFGQQYYIPPQMGSGSGVIVSPDGYIATNNHVVAGTDRVTVTFNDRLTATARVVATVASTDIALLKVDEKDLPYMEFGNSDDVKLGQWVLAVGYPLSLDATVTAGIVSAKGRSLGINRTQSASAIEAFIQTDAAVNPGNSGGALVNANGELVGINSAIASQSGYNQGYGFAIPVNLARKIVDDFMKYGSVKRGYIGVNFVPLSGEDKPEGIKTNEISGLYVNDVVAGGGAAAAGIKSGDVIKKVDGVVINDSPDLQERVGRLNPGDKVKLTVLRDGALKDYTVTLKGEASVGLTAKNATSKGAEVSKLGATFAPATQAQKSKYGINSGVVVTSVTTGKAFDNIGVEKGLIITKVNGQPVNSVADVQKALPLGRNNMVSISGVGEQGSYNYSFPAQ